MTLGLNPARTITMLCLQKIELHKEIHTQPQPLISRETLLDCAQAGTLLERAKDQSRELLSQAEHQCEALLESAKLEFWHRAHVQLQRWESERLAMCESLERIATSVTNQAIRSVLEETVPPQRLSVLLQQLLATQLPVVKATLLCNPQDRENVEQWLNSHSPVPWNLRPDDSLAPQTLILETDEGGFRIDWEHTLETLLIPEAENLIK